MILYRSLISRIRKEGTCDDRERIVLKNSLHTFEQVNKEPDWMWSFIEEECGKNDIVEITDGVLFLKEDFDKLKFVEIDADGVLLQTHTYMNKFLQDLYSGFDGERDIKSWGMRELDALNPELRVAILRLFQDSAFMSTIPFYSCVKPALDLIIECCKKNKYLIPVIHTHCSSNVADARYQQLFSWLVECNFPALLLVDTDKHKTVLQGNVLMTIEDNASNLQQSKAKYKCLISRGHNRFTTVKDLVGVDDLVDTHYYVGKNFDILTFAVLLSGIAFGGV